MLAEPAIRARLDQLGVIPVGGSQATVRDLRAGRDQEVGRRGARARDEDRVGFVLCCGQRLRQIGDQVVGMLDADRQADRGVAHADAGAHVGRHARVGRRAAGWQASDSVPPRLTASLKICSRVEEGERLAARRP